ncbi:uncharacterized protein LOC120661524 [Panicum virgatum]|uniref:uncharacterized protein LOC120661524 n=1 Tax=Panicum virgatum TaxID=38727 RepID=UPI0019D5742B|nr:uncharacterized protein LOC120661524 [Panicum virgatum]
MEDLLAWHYDKKGIFSVKSAYHVLDDGRTRDRCRQRGEGSGSTTSPKAPEFSWKRIWQLRCPPKIRHFLWRFTHNSLPLRMNIARRGMEIDTRCPVCWRLGEDGGHCFLRCKYVKECWRAMNLEGIRIRLSTLLGAEQVSDCILSLKEEEKMATIGLLWSWWNARNKANAGEQRRSTDEVTFSARMAMISTANDKGPRPVSGGRACSWDAPPEGIWKINIDGGFCEENKRGAWGFVVRDSEGKAAMAGAGCMEVVADALCAEAHACVEALKAVAKVGMQSILLETDSQLLVKALKSKEHDQALGGVLFREAKFLIATLFNSVSVKFATRSCNYAAHELAKLGRYRDPEHPAVWMDPLPDFVNLALACDLAEPGVNI